MKNFSINLLKTSVLLIAIICISIFLNSNEVQAEEIFTNEIVKEFYMVDGTNVVMDFNINDKFLMNCDIAGTSNGIKFTKKSAGIYNVSANLNNDNTYKIPMALVYRYYAQNGPKYQFIINIYVLPKMKLNYVQEFDMRAGGDQKYFKWTVGNEEVRINKLYTQSSQLNNNATTTEKREIIGLDNTLSIKENGNNISLSSTKPGDNSFAVKLRLTYQCSIVCRQSALKNENVITTSIIEIPTTVQVSGPEAEAEPETVQTTKYTLTYNANGGAGSIPVAKEYEKDIEVSITNLELSKRGHNFLGWATNQNATSAEYIYGTPGKDKIIMNSTKTLYAVWSKKPPEVTLESIITTTRETINKKGSIEKEEIELKNANGEVIATIFAGEKVTVIEETIDGHYKIKWERDGVYASKSYLNNNITKGIGPNIRTEANGNSKKIGDIKAGQTIERVGQAGDYVEINFAIEGYVKKEEVEVSETSITSLFSNGGLFGKLFNDGIMNLFSKFNLGTVFEMFSINKKQETGSLSKGTEILKDMGNGFKILGERIKSNIQGTDGIPGFGPIIETLIEIPTNKVFKVFTNNLAESSK